MKFSVFPTAAKRETPGIEQWGRERSRVYHSFFWAQARSCTPPVILLASDAWRKQATTLVRILANTHWRIFFFSLGWCRYQGVRGMLGASQFVNAVVFQFSGPDNFSPAKPVLRSLSRSSTSASFYSSCFRSTQINFKGACEETCARLRSAGGNQPTIDL